MQEIVILGNGQLGNSLYDYFYELIENNHGYFNLIHIKDKLNNTKDVDKLFQDFDFDKQNLDGRYFINTIANTNTRYCESDISWSYTLWSNAELPIYFANKISKDYHSKFLQISTGCIWDNETGRMFKSKNGFYEESNQTPLINYSKSKSFAESIRYIIPNTYCIIRPRMLFSDKNIKSNLIWKINNFTELTDEENSMTCVEDLCKFIWHIIKHNITGTYNFCNSGTISPYRIKQLIRETVYHNDTEDYKKITKEELYDKTKIKLTNTLIDSSKSEKFYLGSGIFHVEARMQDMIWKSMDWIKENKKNENAEQITYKAIERIMFGC